MIEEGLGVVPPTNGAEEERMRARAAAAQRVEDLRRAGSVGSLLKSLSAPSAIESTELRRILDEDLTAG